MTCAVFIAHRLWLKKSSLMIVLPGIMFGLAYAMGILVFNFGPVQSVLFQKNSVFVAKIVYFVLGIWAFVSGVLFFKGWLLLYRGLPAARPDG